jgi:hypothetical protein
MKKNTRLRNNLARAIRRLRRMNHRRLTETAWQYQVRIVAQALRNLNMSWQTSNSI